MAREARGGAAARGRDRPPRPRARPRGRRRRRPRVLLGARERRGAARRGSREADRALRRRVPVGREGADRDLRREHGPDGALSAPRASPLRGPCAARRHPGGADVHLRPPAHHRQPHFQRVRRAPVPRCLAVGGRFVGRLPRRHPQAGVLPEREDRGRADRRRCLGDARRDDALRRRVRRAGPHSRARRLCMDEGGARGPRAGVASRAVTTVTAPAVPVPLLDLKKQYATIREEILRATADVYESQHFILGPRVDVVTSPYTFFSTAGAIARLGARAVFVDIEPETFNLDPSKLESAITSRAKLIQPVHLYGQCADMDPIRDVARRKGVPVLEDACQSLGAGYKGVKAGALGEFGAFSFFPSKNLGGFGDGGMVTTQDDAFAAKLRAMRMHGETSRYHHKFVGGNFRLDALQAAILHVKLPHLDGWARARRANAAEIETLYLAAGGRPYEAGGLLFPREAAGREHVFNQFVVRVGKGRRDALKKHLESRQIGCAIYYPVPLHLQECFASLGGRPGDCPEAERAANETLAVPVFPELTGEQKGTLASTLAEFFRET